MRKSVARTGISAAFLLAIMLSPATPVAQDTEQDTASPPAGMPFSRGLGFELFQENCAGCHGADLDGTDEGPPLLHGYYKPGHHSDVAFYRAIEQGSPQHHWNFGDMEPVEGVSRKQAEAIVEYVRWHQRETGLY